MNDYGQCFASVESFLLALLALQLSIFLHELGHFIAAKIFKCSVTIFSIGFGKKLFSWNYRGTEIRLSLIPLGGYVLIPDLLHGEQYNNQRSIENEVLKDVWTAKNINKTTPWKKIIIALMGPMFNIFFAIFLACCIGYFGIPRNTLMDTNRIGYIEQFVFNEFGEKVQSPAAEAGLQCGDKILSVNGKKIKSFVDIQTEIRNCVLQRHDEENLTINLAVKRRESIFPIQIKLFRNSSLYAPCMYDFLIRIFPAQRLIVSAVNNADINESDCLKSGDIIKSVDGVNVFSISDLNEKITSFLNENTQNKFATVNVIRGNSVCSVKVFPQTKLRHVQHVIYKTDSRCLIFFDAADAGRCRKICINTKDNACFGNDRLLCFDLYNDQYFSLNTINGQLIQYHEDWLEFFKSEQEDKKFTFECEYCKPNNLLKNCVTFYCDSKNMHVFEEQHIATLGCLFEKNIKKVYCNPLNLVTSQFRIICGSICKIFEKQDAHNKSQLVGPIEVCNTLTKVADVYVSYFLLLILSLNLNLAIFNLLPLPILDGGHILFAAFEWITKRRMPLRFVSILNAICVLFFVILSIKVSISDVKNILHEHNARDYRSFQVKMLYNQ